MKRIWRLDADRAALEVHNTGWRTCLAGCDAAERGRARQRAVAERKAAALHAQAGRMRAGKATAVRAKEMARRADRMPAAVEPVRRAEKVARIRLPEPAPCGRTPLGAVSLAKAYGEPRPGVTRRGAGGGRLLSGSRRDGHA